MLAAAAAAAPLVPPPGAAPRPARAVNGDGPPPAHTGGFGEPTCLECHEGGPLNDPDGALTLEGVPDRFTRGRRYDLTVALRHPALARAGFELSVRYAGGSATGRQAGRLVAGSPGVGVTLDTARAVVYAHQIAAAAGVESAGQARWSLRWEAPRTPTGAVVFHVAANAANDDNSPFGDLIYAIETRTLATGLSRAPERRGAARLPR